MRGPLGEPPTTRRRGVEVVMEGARLLAASEVCHAEADIVVSSQFTVLLFHPTEAPVSDGDAGVDR